ncbi:MAG: carboxypeptidase-like regulatory domain-containing protein [bacterium]
MWRKIRYVAKSQLITLFVFALLFWASQPAFSKHKVVRFTARHQPLGQVLATIQAQSGIRLVYVNSVVDSFKVLRRFDDMPYDAVRKSLLGTPLDFIQKSRDLWVIVPRSETLDLPAVLAGKITDIYSQQPVAGVNVFIENSNLGATSNSNGVFELRDIPPGRSSIHVRRIGYHDVELELAIRGNARNRVEIALEPKPVPTQEVVVEEASIPTENIAVLTRQTLTRAQLQTPPLANDGEVFEILHQQPGVSRRDMDDVFPHIEGGSATEVGVELDGMPIYVPTFGQNRRSVFAASIIDNLTLYRSGFGVEHGDAMSGVVALRTTEIEQIPYSIYTSASLTGLALNYKKNTRKIGVTGVWRNGKFDNGLRFDRWQGFDWFNKLEYRPAQSHKVTFLALISRGSLTQSNSLSSEQLFSQNLGLRYEFGPRKSSHFSALGYTSRLNEQQKEIGFRLKYKSRVNRFLRATVGVDYTDLESHGTVVLDSLEHYKVARDIALPGDSTGSFYLPIATNPSDLFSQRATILSPYIGIDLEQPLWCLTAGVRMPADLTSGRLYPEPRTTLTITLGQQLNVAFSKGRYYQFTDRSYASEAKSGDHLGRGEFLIKTAAEQPSRADHFRAEATLRLTPGVTASVAYFDKKYDFRDRAYLSRINRWFWILPLKSGRSRGYEYWLAKTAGPLQGWVSYTLNNQVYRSEDGTFFRPYFNRDKILNFSMTYYLPGGLQLKGQYLRATGYPARDWSPERVIISRENTPEVFARKFMTRDVRFGSRRQYALGLTWNFSAAFARESRLNLVAVQSFDEGGTGLHHTLRFWASIIFTN